MCVQSSRVARAHGRQWLTLINFFLFFIFPLIDERSFINRPHNTAGKLTPFIRSFSSFHTLSLNDQTTKLLGDKTENYLPACDWLETAHLKFLCLFIFIIIFLCCVRLCVGYAGDKWQLQFRSIGSSRIASLGCGANKTSDGCTHHRHRYWANAVSNWF